MASNQTIFRLEDSFDDSKEIDNKLKLYKATTGYEFNTLNSTKLTTKNFKQNYNEKLIYDDRYFKCIVNPKPAAMRDFEKKYPGIKVKLCPARLTFRTTKDKQQLKITQFVPKHDHDPSDTVPRLQAYKQQAAKNNIQDTVIMNHEKNLEDSVNSSVLDLPDGQQIQSPIVTESNIEVLSTLPEAAGESFNNIADIAVVCEEDFDILLRNMEINIKSTLNKEEQNQKIHQVNQMLNGIINNEIDFGVASKVGSLSIYLSRSRGRNRGRKNRVIGLPASKRNYTIKSFDQLRETQKKMYILELLFDDEDFIKDVILRKKKIELSNLNDLQLNMPDALSSETINLKTLQNHFEDDAFQHLNKLIEWKRHNNINWTCYSCKNNLDTDDSVECDKCLFWNHWACVKLTEAPINDWFSPKCQVENNNY